MLRALPLAMLIAALVPQAASACTCMMSTQPYGFHASAIFRGRVTKIDTHERSLRDTWTPVEVEFEVSEAWRGPVETTVVVFTGRGGGDCGARFEVGQEYLVPANLNTDGSMNTSSCAGVMHARFADEVLGELGEGWNPEFYDFDWEETPLWRLTMRDRLSRLWKQVGLLYPLVAVCVLAGLGLGLRWSRSSWL